MRGNQIDENLLKAEREISAGYAKAHLERVTTHQRALRYREATKFNPIIRFRDFAIGIPSTRAITKFYENVLGEFFESLQNYQRAEKAASLADLLEATYGWSPSQCF